VEEMIQEKLPARQLLHLTPQECSRFLGWLDAYRGRFFRKE
jgi:hypothetical protein